MKLSVRSDLDMGRLMQAEFEAGERAVTLAMRQSSAELKTRWRSQINGAGLGRKLANTVRSQAYPQSSNSMDAAAMIWTKAPRIVGAHEAGPLITSKDGFWLAIPTPAAGKGRFGRKMTPLTWERRHGIPLRFVYRRGKPSLLVADDARLSRGKRTGGQARPRRGRRRKDGILTGAQTVPIFILVPQVKLAKRLNLFKDAESIGARIADRIVANWR